MNMTMENGHSGCIHWIWSCSISNSHHAPLFMASLWALHPHPSLQLHPAALVRELPFKIFARRQGCGGGPGGMRIHCGHLLQSHWKLSFLVFWEPPSCKLVYTSSISIHIIDISTINHSEMEVMFANLANELGHHLAVHWSGKQLRFVQSSLAWAIKKHSNFHSTSPYHCWVLDPE